MSQHSLLDQIDLCANRSRGNPQSQAAHEKIVSTKREIHERILKLIRARGEYGATSKEVAAAIGKPVNCISGRLSELKMTGQLKKSELTRRGAAVLIVA